MSVLTRPLTYEDLEHFPNDGNRYEVVYGELHVSAAPDPSHQKFLGLLFLLLAPHVRQRRLGEVYFAPFDVRPLGSDLVQPDLVFIRRDRLDRFERGDFVGPADLVVEVLSPSTKSYDETVKAKLYAEAGVPEYWLPDPVDRTFRILVLRAGRYEALAPDEHGRFRSTIIPDLIVDPPALFAELDE
jgi:Uma2 family endonuclease